MLYLAHNLKKQKGNKYGNSSTRKSLPFPGPFVEYDPGAGTSKATSMSILSINTPVTYDFKAPATANATATLTATQVAAGYITSTSASATTLTMPTGTLLGAALGASQGTVFELYIDNTAGANTVTIAVAVNGILSAAAVAGSTAGAGLLTIPSGVTGIAEFTIVFSSATAYVFTRTA